jgi:hypothetical protein
MVTKFITLTLCDLCKKPIMEGQLYFRVDKMYKGKATLHKVRDLKHFCEKCMKGLCKNELTYIVVRGIIVDGVK